MGEKGNVSDVAQVSTAVASSPGLADTVVSVVSSAGENIASRAGTVAEGVAMGIAEERVRERLQQHRDAKEGEHDDPGPTPPGTQPPTA
jgi:hypothetical protein